MAPGIFDFANAALDVADEYEELLDRLKIVSENCFHGNSQGAEELAHEMAEFTSSKVKKLRKMANSLGVSGC